MSWYRPSLSWTDILKFTWIQEKKELKWKTFLWWSLFLTHAEIFTIGQDILKLTSLYNFYFLEPTSSTRSIRIDPKGTAEFLSGHVWVDPSSIPDRTSSGIRRQLSVRHLLPTTDRYEVVFYFVGFLTIIIYCSSDPKLILIWRHLLGGFSMTLY